jgi:hypothetical protein
MIPVAALSVAAVTLIPATASAAPLTEASVSANWSGYTATGAQFSSVSGSWVQPSASCDSGSGDAAFWVGLGGADGQSQALEQAGTQIDCSSGAPTYSAWYELVPSAPAQFSELSVSPGDRISATVGVDGQQVSISMTNHTTGRTANKSLRMDDPDVSSAEWIAEAPSSCIGGSLDSCQPVALADFGKVNFSDATATANGHTGSISDPAWTAQPIQLAAGAADRFAGGGFDGSDQGGASAATQAGAVPSELSVDGSAFSVTWQNTTDDQSSSDPAVVPVPDGGYGDGWGDGNGYGDGGYGDGSYGDGAYGDGGYGWGGYGGYGGYGYGGA